MPPHEINVALSTYIFFQFFREQQRSRDLNIVTGFQLMDGDLHMFILEGIRDRAVSSLWNTLPRPENSGELYIVTSASCQCCILSLTYST